MRAFQIKMKGGNTWFTGYKSLNFKMYHTASARRGEELGHPEETRSRDVNPLHRKESAELGGDPWSLGSPLEGLYVPSGLGRTDVWVSLPDVLPPQPWMRMDGWMDGWTLCLLNCDLTGTLS